MYMLCTFKVFIYLWFLCNHAENNKKKDERGFSGCFWIAACCYRENWVPNNCPSKSKDTQCFSRLAATEGLPLHPNKHGQAHRGCVLACQLLFPQSIGSQLPHCLPSYDISSDIWTCIWMFLSPTATLNAEVMHSIHVLLFMCECVPAHIHNTLLSLSALIGAI